MGISSELASEIYDEDDLGELLKSTIFLTPLVTWSRTTPTLTQVTQFQD